MAKKTKDFFGYKLNISGPLKFKKRVINGKLVEIDPATDAPLTKTAKRKYLQQRQSELSKIGKDNRQRLKGHLSKLVHSSPTLSKLLKISKERQEFKKSIIEGRAPWDLSEVPVSNFAPSTLKAEGLQNKEYLTNAEAQRLFNRQEKEYAIIEEKHNVFNRNSIEAAVRKREEERNMIQGIWKQKQGDGGQFLETGDNLIESDVSKQKVNQNILKDLDSSNDKTDTATINESKVEDQNNNALKIKKEDKYDKSVKRPLTALDVEDGTTHTERVEMANWRRGIRKQHLTNLISAKPDNQKVNKWKMELASLRDDDEEKNPYTGRV